MKRLNISSPNEYSKLSVRDELANNVAKFHYFLTSIAVSPSFKAAVFLKYGFQPQLKVNFSPLVQTWVLSDRLFRIVPNIEEINHSRERHKED